jgi:CRISPR-associated protein Csx17
MKELLLAGCTSEPLMSYLKALGVFRLVAEQKDPTAMLSWQAGAACLGTHLNGDELITFFLEKYRPTPIVAPWNGGSGFYGGGSAPVDALAESSGERLESYREVIGRVMKLVPKGKPKDEEKQSLLCECRAELPDEVVPWLDVCFVLGDEGARFFPLLGTGGNDGRLDFTNNFMQRLSEVLSFDDNAQPQNSAHLLEAALFGDRAQALVSLGKAAVGQFNPGGIGGPNGVQGTFEADSRVNPWDYILMIEGALLFAGSVARRFGANAIGRVIFPFSVGSVAVGYGSATASEETSEGSRAELWLPQWEDGATLNEVQQLFAEGRAQLDRRQATNSVEFALAVNLLGVSKGVTSFSRFGFLKRNGLAFLAAPLGRVAVTPRPNAQLLNDPPLVQWIDQLRRACRDKDATPVRYQVAMRGIDQAIWEFANRSEHGNDAKYLVAVLRALGRAEETLAGGQRFCEEKFIRPLQGLSDQWLVQAEDHSREFVLAAAIAGIKRDVLSPLRAYLEEVVITKFVSWSPGSTSAVWSRRDLAGNLSAVFRRRQMEAYRSGLRGVPLNAWYHARPKDVSAFLCEETDDEKLAELVWAMTAVNWLEPHSIKGCIADTDDADISFEFGVPRLVVEPLSIDSWRRPNGPLVWNVELDATSTIPDPDVFHVLASGRHDAVGQCVERAARRLNSNGRPVIGHRNRQHASRSLSVVSTIPPDRLLAAMLFPLSARNLTLIANTVLYPPEAKE